MSEIGRTAAVIVALTVGAACDKGPPEPRPVRPAPPAGACERAVAQLDVVLKDMLQDMDDDEQLVTIAHFPQVRAIFLDECQHRPWSRRVIDCMTAATILADLQACEQGVPMDDRKAMQARLDAALNK